MSTHWTVLNNSPFEYDAKPGRMTYFPYVIIDIFRKRASKIRV